MRDIAVGFLWHMHQPYYKDPITGTYLMPRVRLHSIRGYYDMIALLREYPNIRCTFNLVPSLLAQLIDYTDAGCRDEDFLYHFFKDELEVERHPSSGLLSFTIPDKNYERVMWHV